MQEIIIIVAISSIPLMIGLYIFWYSWQTEKRLAELEDEYKRSNRVNLWELKDAFIYQDNQKADLKKFKHFINIKPAADWLNSTTKIHLN